MPEEASVSGQLGDIEWAASIPVEALPAPACPVDPLASSRGSALAGGLTEFPSAQRMTCLHSSIIMQLDGLLHAVLRLRIERDVMAHSLQRSFTEVFGLAAFESCSSFCGLFFHDAEHVPEMVRAAELHRAYGLFVVPFQPDAAWYATLYKASLLPSGLIFSLPRGVFGPDIPTIAIFSSFNRVTGARHRTRPERRISIECVPSFTTASGRLGPRPRVLHRVSPLASARAPSRSMDTAMAVEPEVAYVVPLLLYMTSRWDV